MSSKKYLYEMTWEKWNLLKQSTKEIYIRDSRNIQGDPIQKMLDKQKELASSSEDVRQDAEQITKLHPDVIQEIAEATAKVLIISVSEKCKSLEQENQNLKAEVSELHLDIQDLENKIENLQRNHNIELARTKRILNERIKILESTNEELTRKEQIFDEIKAAYRQVYAKERKVHVIESIKYLCDLGEKIIDTEVSS